MGIGKQKSHAKREKVQSKKASKRRNNAKIVHAWRENSKLSQAELDQNAKDTDDTTGAILTGRAKHHEKVEAKRKIREMLNYKKAERQAIKKKTINADEKSIRKSLCEEIKTLKSEFSFGGAVETADTMADEAQNDGSL
mmetsp:Transcript_24196/g.44168  ORF Transcript_24196/g.44168 Transcript_24196/m.44168 type:complete len:139 (+) Transcript_24196:26-442(+)